jgi:hypothetical protein
MRTSISWSRISCPSSRGVRPGASIQKSARVRSRSVISSAWAEVKTAPSASRPRSTRSKRGARKAATECRRRSGESSATRGGPPRFDGSGRHRSGHRLEECAPAAVGGVGLGAGGAVVVVEAVGEAFGDLRVARVEPREALHQVRRVAGPPRHEVGEGRVHPRGGVPRAEGEGAFVGLDRFVEAVLRVEGEGERAEALGVVRVQLDGAAHGVEGTVGLAPRVEHRAQHGQGLRGAGREGDGPLRVVKGPVEVAGVEAEVGGDAVRVRVGRVGAQDEIDRLQRAVAVARGVEGDRAPDRVEVPVGARGPRPVVASLGGGASGHAIRVWARRCAARRRRGPRRPRRAPRRGP